MEVTGLCSKVGPIRHHTCSTREEHRKEKQTERVEPTVISDCSCALMKDQRLGLRYVKLWREFLKNFD